MITIIMIIIIYNYWYCNKIRNDMTDISIAKLKCNWHSLHHPKTLMNKSEFKNEMSEAYKDETEQCKILVSKITWKLQKIIKLFKKI